jgi:hypothetical protein
MCGCTGPSGSNGANGGNCLVSSSPVSTNQPYGGVLITCPGEAPLMINNGPGGVATTGSTSSFSPTIAIEPCGSASAQYKEALLGLVGGGVYAFYAGTSGSTLAAANVLIPDNNYWDTDTSECNFSVTTASDGTRTVSWNGSTNNGHPAGYYPAGSVVYTPATMSWNPGP